MSVELGELTSLEPPAVEGLEIARHLAISPDGKHVYVVRAMPKAGGTPPESSIGQYARNPSGTLSPLEPYEVLVPSWPPEGPVLVSDDGRHVYVASGGGVFQYARDQETGQLAPLTPRLVEGLKIGGIENSEKVEKVFAMALSPDGLNLYVLHYLNRSVIHQFSRNPETGILKLLSPPEAEFKFSSGSGFYFGQGIVISPDGKFVYSIGDPGFNMFRRDGIAGQLTEFGFFTIEIDQALTGFRGFVSEIGGTGLAISPDGLDLYLLGFGFHIWHIRRNPTSGGPLSEEAITVSPMEGYSYGTGIAVSPDGLSLYTSMGSLGSYTRDAATGELEGVDELIGINGYRIVLSPDGKNLYIPNEHFIYQLARAEQATEGDGPGGGFVAVGPSVNGTVT